VKAILADHNIVGHVRALVTVLRSEPWAIFWESLALELYTFPQLGLTPRTPDDELWRVCQREQTILLTANRNHEGADSLEAVIRTESRPDSLPVFTIANPRLLFHSREYADRVAERLLGYLVDIDRYRGTGRLYLP
jgi:hypothetical protein